MIKDALLFLTGLGAKTSEVKLMDLGGRKRLLVHGDHNREMELEPAARNHQVFSIASLVTAIERFGAEMASVFVNEASVTVLLDDITRDDKVTLELISSPQMERLSRLAHPTPQRELVSALRHELAGSFDPRFLAVVRRLDFTRRGDGKSHIEHGKESLGRSVEAAVQSAEGEIPEEVIFEVPLWGVPGDFNSNVKLKYAVDLDTTKETIALHPVGDQLWFETDQVLQRLADRISSDLEVSADASAVTVLRGCP